MTRAAAPTKLLWLDALCDWLDEHDAPCGRPQLLAIAVQVLRHASSRTGGDIYPSLETLAADAGVGKRTALQARRHLQKHGWLIDTGARRGRGRACVFRLSVPEDTGNAGSSDTGSGNTVPDDTAIPVSGDTESKTVPGDTEYSVSRDTESANVVPTETTYPVPRATESPVEVAHDTGYAVSDDTATPDAVPTRFPRGVTQPPDPLTPGSLSSASGGSSGHPVAERTGSHAVAGDTASRIAKVRPLWGASNEPPGVLDDVRAELGLPERRRMPGEENRVLAFLERYRWLPEQAAAALRALGAEVQDDPGKAKWLDGVQTWSLQVLGRALSSAATPAPARRKKTALERQLERVRRFQAEEEARREPR